ncbi:MAG: hypothetical protein M0T71_10280 [Actinomycetota bacterium]|nr:hypothetical protein [Actinomycetota bacterium]
MTPTPARPHPRRTEPAGRTAARSWVPALVLVGYGLLALAAYWPLWPGDPSRMPLCACGDPAQGVWFLGWLPYALGHGLNPLYTHLIDAPVGVNLAQNTEMPLLGLLTAPLTLAAGPVASFNLLMWLAYPLSAASMYLVARRLVASELAAGLAGLLYGFSAYVVGEGYGHLNLSFVPLPPILLLLVLELVVRQRQPPLRTGLLLGLTATAQYLVSPEVLSTTAVVAVLGVALLAAAHPRAATAGRLAHAAKGFAVALALAGVLCGYPIWYLAAGPGRIHGPVQGFGNPYRADLLGPVVPTPAERLAPAAWQAVGARFVGATFPENGSYLGVPLLVAAVALAVRFRRNRWLPFLGAMAGLAFLLSLGPRLLVDGHDTGIPLPFSLLVHLPLLGSVLPARLSLYQDAFVALLVAVGVDELVALHRSRAARASTRRRRPATAGLVAAGLVAAAPLVPSWPDATMPAGIPALFTSVTLQPALGRAIPAGTTVLTYPFAVSPYDQPMLWQAAAGDRFRLVGGYAITPARGGAPTAFPPALQPLAVQAALGYEALGPSGYLESTAPDLGALTGSARAYLRHNHVGAVVVDPALGNNGALVARWFAQVLGSPGTPLGGVLVWSDVPARLPPRRAPAAG